MPYLIIIVYGVMNFLYCKAIQVANRCAQVTEFYGAHLQNDATLLVLPADRARGLPGAGHL